MRRVWPLALLLMVTGCATVAERAYYPNPADPETRVLAEALWRAAKAASDDPGEYSFAMIRTPKVSAYTVEDATLSFTQGLARQPAKRSGPPRGGWLAAKPTLEDRLSRLEPLEAEKQAAQ